jgi:hypothetical protein
LESSPIVAENLVLIATEIESDSEGVTAETVIWRIPVDSAGRLLGRYLADLKVTERRPKGTQLRALTPGSDMELRPDQSVVLALRPEEVSSLDALQLQNPDGRIFAELQTDTSKLVEEIGWWFSLKLLNGGLVLQAALAR